MKVMKDANPRLLLQSHNDWLLEQNSEDISVLNWTRQLLKRCFKFKRVHVIQSWFQYYHELQGWGLLKKKKEYWKAIWMNICFSFIDIHVFQLFIFHKESVEYIHFLLRKKRGNFLSCLCMAFEKYLLRLLY